MISLTLKNNKEFRDFIIKNLVLPEECSQVLEYLVNTGGYVETICNKSDNLHRIIKQEYPETISMAYSGYIKNFILKQHFGLVDLIADVTSENFYGKISGFDIYPWTGKEGVKGKINFLVVGILFRNRIIPFYVVHLKLGASKAKFIGEAIRYCASLGLKIGKILLDRGFYSGEVINKIDAEKIHYLIFAPKKALFKCMLEGTEESIVVEHEIVYNKNFTKNKIYTEIALIKDVRGYDWVFATNLSIREIEKYVEIYKKRWNIETMFRVHDKARIQTKSKNPTLRLFYFLLGMLLVTIWNIFCKEKCTFKLFLTYISETVDKTKIITKTITE